MLADEGIHFSDIANYVAMFLVPALGFLLKMIHDMGKEVTTLKTEMKAAKDDLEKRRLDCQKLFERKADK